MTIATFSGDKPFKPVARIKPAVRHVTEIVPQSVMPKLPTASL